MENPELWRRVKSLQYISPFRYFLRFLGAHFIITCFGLYQVVMVIRLIYGIQSQTSQSFRATRVGCNCPISTDLILVFYLKGCEEKRLIFPCNASRSVDNSSSAPLKMDGFLAITNISDESKSSISITIDGSDDDWQTVVLYGSLYARWTAYGISFLREPVPIRKEFYISYYPPLPWYSSILLPRVLSALGCIGVVCLSCFGYLKAGKMFCACTIAAMCTASAVSAIGLAPLCSTAAVASTMASIVLAASIPALVRDGGQYVDVLALLSVLWLGTVAFGTCAASEFAGCAASISADPPLMQAVAVALFALLLANRHRFRAHAVYAAGADGESASRLWSELLDTERGTLESLNVVCRGIAGRCPAPCYTRQLDRRRYNCNASTEGVAAVVAERLGSSYLGSSESAWEPAPAWSVAGVAGTIDAGLPVASLDRLYSQVRRSGT